MKSSVSRAIAIFGAVSLSLSLTSGTWAATPTATSQSLTMAHDTTVTITIQGTSPDGQRLTFSIASQPSHGTLGQLYSSWTAQAKVPYTPAPGYVGPDSFTFQCSETGGTSSPATVSITVGCLLSGKITYQLSDGSTAGLSSYQLRFKPTSGANQYTTTAADGSYSIPLALGWSGTVNAYDSTNYSIDPTARTYASLAADQLSQDYLASSTSAPPPPPPPPPPPDPLPDPVYQNGPDFDGDGDADMDDFGILQRCFSGTGIAAPIADRIADLDSDGDVDDADINLQLGASNGPGVAFTPIPPPVSTGKTWYVSNGGKDSWTGRYSEPSADRTDGPFLTVQKAANVAQAGDTISIRGGDYDLTANAAYAYAVIHFVNSGQAGKPITVTGYGSEIPTLRSSSSKAIFDFTTQWGNNTVGFGYYNFRQLKINGGRAGWMFYPPGVNWDTSRPVSDLWVGQIHDITIEDVEVDGNGMVEAAIYCRNAGVRNLTVRRCNFHHTVGTEGTIDIGEWMDTDIAHSIPSSASHDILVEDCLLHEVVHTQGNGIVTQPCVFNVTIRRCQVWNNGKYGIAFKGSSNFNVDRCAVWGNRETSMYCRGFGGDSGAARPPAPNQFLLTNSIFIAPADQSGGSALNWRENTSITAYNCTIVGLRKAALGQAGGYAFLLGNDHAIPCTGILRNCIVVGGNDSPSIRFFTGNGLAYAVNTRYEAGANLLYCTNPTSFRYQNYTYDKLAGWQGYWAVGAANGDDGLNGPRATNADATSIFSNPMFAGYDPALTPLAYAWTSNLFDPANHCDVRLLSTSPAFNLGENLSSMNIPELMVDYDGNPRPATGAWTVGAFQTPVQ